MRRDYCFKVSGVTEDRWVRASDAVHWIRLVRRTDVIPELDVLVEALLHKCNGVIDPDRFGELSVGLEVPRLV